MSSFKKTQKMIKNAFEANNLKTQVRQESVNTLNSIIDKLLESIIDTAVELARNDANGYDANMRPNSAKRKLEKEENDVQVKRINSTTSLANDQQKIKPVTSSSLHQIDLSKEEKLSISPHYVIKAIELLGLSELIDWESIDLSKVQVSAPKFMNEHFVIDEDETLIKVENPKT